MVGNIDLVKWVRCRSHVQQDALYEGDDCATSIVGLLASAVTLSYQA